MLYSTLLIISFFCTDTLQQSEDKPVQIVDFTLPDVVSGDTFSLSDLDHSKAIVVVFTSNYCPYAKLYNDRINHLVEQYRGKGISFVLVNSNNPAKSNADNPDAMAKKVAELGIKTPYLSDSNQKIADMFGAQKTPEVFLLTHTGTNKYKIAYKGAIDDNPQVASDVSHYFLQEAIESLLKGNRPPKEYVHPIGCMIKR